MLHFWQYLKHVCKPQKGGLKEGATFEKGSDAVVAMEKHKFGECHKDEDQDKSKGVCWGGDLESDRVCDQDISTSVPDTDYRLVGMYRQDTAHGQLQGQTDNVHGMSGDENRETESESERSSSDFTSQGNIPAGTVVNLAGYRRKLYHLTEKGAHSLDWSTEVQVGSIPDLTNDDAKVEAGTTQVGADRLNQLLSADVWQYKQEVQQVSGLQPHNGKHNTTQNMVQQQQQKPDTDTEKLANIDPGVSIDYEDMGQTNLNMNVNGRPGQSDRDAKQHTTERTGRCTKCVRFALPGTVMMATAHTYEGELQVAQVNTLYDKGKENANCLRSGMICPQSGQGHADISYNQTKCHGLNVHTTDDGASMCVSCKVKEVEVSDNNTARTLTTANQLSTSVWPLDNV